MSTALKNYLDDGANYQARSVLMFLQNCSDIEESWDDIKKKYMADISVARWENCREQGYVVSLNSSDYKRCVHIAFFEHRNSDSICAVKWEQAGLINSPTINTAKFGDMYKDKYDVSFEVTWGKIKDMADWIKGELREFWLDSM